MNEVSPFKQNVTLVALPDAEACKQRCYTLHEDMDQIVLYQAKKKKRKVKNHRILTLSRESFNDPDQGAKAHNVTYQKAHQITIRLVCSLDSVEN